VSRSSVKASDLFKVAVLALFACGMVSSILLDTGLSDLLSEDLANLLAAFRKGDWL
jgi:hypothetical protein